MPDYQVKKEDLLPLPQCTCNILQNANCCAHVNLDMEIVLVREGELFMCILGEEYLIRAGEGIFVLPFEPHDFRTREHSQTLVYTFPQTLIAVTGRFLALHTPLTRIFAVPPTLAAYLWAAAPAADRGNAVDGMEEAGMVAPLLSLLCRTCVFTDAPRKENDLFLEALAYIDRHYADDLSLRTLSRALGVTDKKLSRVFYREAGIPFLEYVTLRRLSAAKGLLAAGGRTVAQVAYEAGFASIRTFNRAFQRYNGMTPQMFAHQKTSAENEGGRDW